MNIEQTVMWIITYSGDAKSSAMEAIQHAKNNEMEHAEKLMEDSENELSKAHKEQTKMLQNEAQGEKVDMSLLLVHAQDHLMTAVTFKDLAKEFVELYKNTK